MHRDYENISSKPMHCLATCILMIVKSLDSNSKLTQESIAHSLGLKKNEVNEYYSGIKVDLIKIKQVFATENLILKVEYIKANTLEEWQFQELIEDSLIAGTHVICTLASRVLYDDVTSMHGHAVLLVAIDGNKAEIIDPDHLQVHRNLVSVERLYYAAHKQSAGLLMFSN